MRKKLLKEIAEEFKYDPLPLISMSTLMFLSYQMP